MSNKFLNQTGLVVLRDWVLGKIANHNHSASDITSGTINSDRLPASVKLPTVSASDNGKILCVANGEWAATELPSASGVSF